MLTENTENTIDDQRDVPAAITDTGCERELNEDRYAVIECPSGLLWLVCDGMGGTSGGELAAQLAIDSIRRALENTNPLSAEEALEKGFNEANRIVVLRRQNQAFSQMGTTAVGALFQGKEVVIANVGDSRAYLIRGRAIKQLSSDHTFVQELVNRGEITYEEALSHPRAHVLTRAIGAETILKIDFFKYWIWDVPEEERDVLLLCSDGLYSHVDDGEVAQMVHDYSPQKACAKLVELAKSRGGYDNITVTIVPLSGQLNDSAPAGYKPQDFSVPKEEKPTINYNAFSLVKDLGVMILLTVFSLLGVLTWFFINLKG